MDTQRASGTTATSFCTYIDLRLVNPDTTLLEQHLAEERNIRLQNTLTLDTPIQAGRRHRRNPLDRRHHPQCP